MSRPSGAGELDDGRRELVAIGAALLHGAFENRCIALGSSISSLPIEWIGRKRNKGGDTGLSVFSSPAKLAGAISR